MLNGTANSMGFAPFQWKLFHSVDLPPCPIQSEQHKTVEAPREERWRCRRRSRRRYACGGDHNGGCRWPQLHRETADKRRSSRWRPYIRFTSALIRPRRESEGRRVGLSRRARLPVDVIVLLPPRSTLLETWSSYTRSRRLRFCPTPFLSRRQPWVSLPSPGCCYQRVGPDLAISYLTAIATVIRAEGWMELTWGA